MTKVEAFRNHLAEKKSALIAGLVEHQDMPAKMRRQLLEEFDAHAAAKLKEVEADSEFELALVAFAASRGRVLEMWVTTTKEGKEREITFNPEILQNHTIAPLIKFGLAAYVSEQVRKHI